MIENKDKLNDLQQHHLTLIDDINIKASSSNELITHAFFNHITDLMIDNGDLPSATYSPYIKEVSNDETKMKNMKIDGFHYDRDDDFTKNSITLILSDYQNEESYQKSKKEYEQLMAGELPPMSQEQQNFIKDQYKFYDENNDRLKEKIIADTPGASRDAWV